jgi:hypothetical protein
VQTLDFEREISIWSGAMKKYLRGLVAITGGLLVVLIALVLARDVLLKVVARFQIEAETGLRAEIGELKTTLGTGLFHVRNLKLFNPPEFGGSLMAEVPEILVDLDPEKASGGKLSFHRLRLELTSLNIVRRADGRLNLDGVEKKIRERMARRKKRKGERFEFEFGGISELRLTVRKVHYTDLDRPGRSRALDLAVQDEVVTGLQTGEDLQRWAGAMLFRVLMHLSLGDRDGAGLEQAHDGAAGDSGGGPAGESEVRHHAGSAVSAPRGLD